MTSWEESIVIEKYLVDRIARCLGVSSVAVTYGGASGWEARCDIGFGSVMLIGPNPVEALENLEAHLQKIRAKEGEQ